MMPDGPSHDQLTGAGLAAVRHKLGLSQSQLADLLGIPVNTLARWERGDVTIRHPRILSLALEALGDRRSASHMPNRVAS